MKTLAFFIMTLSSLSFAESCKQVYQNSYDKKMAKFKKAYNKYHDQKFNMAMSSDVVISALAQNLQMPKKEDYNIYEDKVLNAIDQKITYTPEYIKDLLKKLKKKKGLEQITSDDLRGAFKHGVDTEDFCSGIFKKYTLKQINRYVKKYLKNSVDTINSNSRSIANDDLPKPDTQSNEFKNLNVSTQKQ
ncbi:MAG: hypothetical protein N4A33_04910 [Bacteriovoracaceae bacterium]|jgi:hypothetical protein|nr:hypothetical protein [Bacteriovoracaceae bacterium]